ncbi:MAG: galactokinase [Chloroflexi bacterium]|uniref:Galactokinase n=1 Tax=Candidatus Chlorohelix allophototropha TaxID=3003348 RepID=A0A8T7M642_9CHLR|nr:galactokinase [Chloroflexota bacterium]WJW69364.1 galactokinase [Chloroflexota bacterium L227-S17]
MEESIRIEQVKIEFKKAFGVAPAFVARAPGRVNLIGEHTDYNGGFVLPVAIDRSVLIAIAPITDARHFELVSLEYNDSATFEPANLEPIVGKAPMWAKYVQGVMWALAQSGLLDLNGLPGAQLLIQGDVPRGAGLSSSAALEVAAALAFLHLGGSSFERVQMALACQKAENEYIGVKSGIMDQFISAMGEPDSALLIDTRSLEFRTIPLGLEELGYKIVAVDSAVPRTLAGSAYNKRRAECEEAARILSNQLGLPNRSQLRDISLSDFNNQAETLPETLRMRARHVITEDARTLEAIERMQAGFTNPANLRRFGELLNASHTSLSDDYEVSCAELDLLVDLAQAVPGVIGARMTGAGFGGCTVNIVATKCLPDFEEKVVQEYRQRTGLNAQSHICKAVRGGEIV